MFTADALFGVFLNATHSIKGKVRFSLIMSKGKAKQSQQQSKSETLHGLMEET